MKAEIIQEYGFGKYFAIKISDLPKKVCGRNEIVFRVSQYEYSNDFDMTTIFIKIVNKINEGENK